MRSTLFSVAPRALIRPVRAQRARLVRAIFAATVCVAGVGSGYAHAAGDNAIESSNPTEGEVVTVAPTQIQLRFKNPVGGAEAVAKMGLSLSCEGKLTNLGAPQLAADGVTVSAALTQIPDNGNCTVSWSLPDGSSGSFKFISQAQATTTTASTVPTGDTVPTQPTPGEVTEPPRLGGPIGLVRWIVFLAVSALVGGCLFIKFVWPEGVEYPIVDRYLRQVTVASVLGLFVLMSLMNARETGGSIGSAFLPTAWGPVLETAAGRAVIVRLAGICVLGYLSWSAIKLYDPNRTVYIALAIGFTILSYGFDRTTGRAVALGVLLAAAHMGAVAWWVGGILIVWRVVLRGPGEGDLVHALRGWYRIANPLALAAIATGVAQAYRVDNLSFINSGHGRLVLFKALIVGLMFFVTSAVRHYVLRGMTKAKNLDQRTVYRLKRPVGLELSLSVAVLAASSWLMAMRPPYVLLPTRGPVTEYAIVQDMSGKDDFRVRVSITPGNVGANKVLIELFGPKRIQNLTVALVPSNPAFSGYTIAVPITRPGGAVINEDVGMALRAPGQWSIEVSGVTTVGDLEPLKGTFIIADGVTVTTLPGKAGTSTTVATSATTLAPASATTLAPTATTTTTLVGG